MTGVERRRRSKLADSHPAYPHPAEQPAPPAGERIEPGPAMAAASRVTTERDEAARWAAAMARKTARDAAWGWAAARKRIDRRTGDWAAAMAHARDTGASDTVLREYIGEAARQAHVDVADIPVQVWRAAGLDP